MNIGRPKDLVKKKKILEAAKQLFLKQGFHGSSMNQIAKEAGVTKLTVYNHFQDKESLFTCAIEETCEELINAQPIQLNENSNFLEVLNQVCRLILQIVNLPEAIKLEHLLLELAAEQNPLAQPFYNASHHRLFVMWTVFFTQAAQYGFIQQDDPKNQTGILLSLLLGHRHHEILLGIKNIPTEAEKIQIVDQAIELFMMKYKKAT